MNSRWLGSALAVRDVRVAVRAVDEVGVDRRVYVRAGHARRVTSTAASVPSATATTSKDGNARRRWPAAAFGQRWDGATLKKLFERMEEMPPDDPAARLTREAVRRHPRVSPERQQHSRRNGGARRGQRRAGGDQVQQSAAKVVSWRASCEEPCPARPLLASLRSRPRRGGARAIALRARRVEDLRRRPGEHALLAARSDQQGQLLEAEDRLARSTPMRSAAPDTLYSATPLFVRNVLYTTVGHDSHRRRAQSRRPARCCGSTSKTRGRAARTRRERARAAAWRTGRALMDPISASST